MLLMAVCIASNRAEPMAEEARAVINLAGDAVNALKHGNMCLANENCFPINIIDNLCCSEKGLMGKCCNMFAYISERP